MQINEETFEEQDSRAHSKGLGASLVGASKHKLEDVKHLVQGGELEYEQQNMPDDIVKLSLFMSVNQMYFYRNKASNPCKRLY